MVLLIFLLVLSTVGATPATLSIVPWPGKFTTTVPGYYSRNIGIVKELSGNSVVTLAISNAKCSKDRNIDITWVLRSTSCLREYRAITSWKKYATVLRAFLQDPGRRFDNSTGYYLKSKKESFNCSRKNTVFILKDYSDHTWVQYPDTSSTPSVVKSRNSREKRDQGISKLNGYHEPKTTVDYPDYMDGNTTIDHAAVKGISEIIHNNVSSSELLRGNTQENTVSPPTVYNTDGSTIMIKHTTVKDKILSHSSNLNPSRPTFHTIAQGNGVLSHPQLHNIAVVPETASYLLIVDIHTRGYFSVDIEVEMKRQNGGFLSPQDYAFMIFSMTMCFVYLCYATIWFRWFRCSFRNMKMVHYCITIVILVEFANYTLLLLDYLITNFDGNPSQAVENIQEISGVFSRCISRLLVVIACLGYGFTKFTLGSSFHRVVGIFIPYFIVTGIIRLMEKGKLQPPGGQLELSFVPLMILELVIYLWVVIGFVRTWRTLKALGDINRLSRYRLFVVAIILYILLYIVVGIAFMVYMIHMSKSRSPRQCESSVSRWPIYAFNDVPFVFLLLVIIIVWRPMEEIRRFQT